MATSLEEMNTLFLRYLFFSEFQVNDGTCLIYEGNPISGHGKKCSLLNREFSEPGLFHYNVSHGEPGTSSRENILFGNKARNRSPPFSEDKELLLNSENNRMLYSLSQLFQCPKRQCLFFESFEKFQFSFSCKSTRGITT